MKQKEIKELKYNEEAKVINIANSNINNLSEVMNSNIGIDKSEREAQEDKFGKNEIIPPKFSHIKKFLEAITEPFNLLLWVIGIIEMVIFFTVKDINGGYDYINLISSIMVIFMVFLAGTVDYRQEFKAYKTNLELNKMIENNFLIYNGELKDLDNINFVELKKDLIFKEQSELLIGDVIVLHQGDIIPADARILWQQNLLIDQSTLTGESQSVTKSVDNAEARLIDLQNIIFAQTTVVAGTCVAVIINTAEQNYASSIIKMVEEDEESDYEKGLAKITKILVSSILIMVPIIFLAAFGRNGWTDWANPLIFALSIAVALTPEALPAIISSNLKLGSKQLAKGKVVIKNLAVVQNMGSVNILATDKTGTLTLDEIELNHWCNLDSTQDTGLSKLLFLNAAYQQNLSNNIDRAIYKKFENDFSVKDYTIIKDIPFDHETRTTSVLLKYKEDMFQITKGSVEEMLSNISFIRKNDEVIKITNADIEDIKKIIAKWTKDGFRTIVVATKQTSEIDYSDMIFEGLAFFEDVLKPGVIEAIKIIKEYNIDLKVLTGDAEDIAINIANKIGMDNVQTILGSEIDRMTNQELSKVVESINIFSKLSPINKAVVVDLLKKDNVVAFLGDGVNDAPALRRADVGISVNNGTPLAKAAADVILLEKDLAVLENSFVKGREIFSNAIKYIKITVAANFGIMISLLISALWFEFAAMSPIQLLIQNLIFDFANLIFVFDSVDKDTVRKPMKWNTNTIIPFGIWNGLVETIISVLNFVILGFGFGMLQNGAQITDPETLNQFQTAFFLESMLTHILIIFVYRTEKISFIQSRPSKTLWLGMLGFATIPFMFIFIDGSLEKPNLNFAPMLGDEKAWWWLVLVGLLVLAWILAETFKFAYKKVFKSWL
ncbi:HAD-IC family P-type ATPase [[Acholeplasma] multilocale]|uniref:HAD-IC family P-type ATPase n=1 Tax=[Acholeplasma] multilocale TaxID=264638 RepID=UPI00054D6712|nr:HAD-IC family P-type ATPase [[Acholeplasma] multilocale]